MRYCLQVRPEALDDLSGAYNWYEDRVTGLGEDFLLAVRGAQSRLLDHPLAGAVVFDGVRRLLVPKFPYALFYEVTDETITIIGCFHARRDPTEWHGRKS